MPPALQSDQGPDHYDFSTKTLFSINIVSAVSGVVIVVSILFLRRLHPPVAYTAAFRLSFWLGIECFVSHLTSTVASRLPTYSGGVQHTQVLLRILVWSQFAMPLWFVLLNVAIATDLLLSLVIHVQSPRLRRIHPWYVPVASTTAFVLALPLLIYRTEYIEEHNAFSVQFPSALSVKLYYVLAFDVWIAFGIAYCALVIGTVVAYLIVQVRRKRKSLCDQQVVPGDLIVQREEMHSRGDADILKVPVQFAPNKELAEIISKSGASSSSTSSIGPRTLSRNCSAASLGPSGDEALAKARGREWAHCSDASPLSATSCTGYGGHIAVEAGGKAVVAPPSGAKARRQSDLWAIVDTLPTGAEDLTKLDMASSDEGNGADNKDRTSYIDSLDSIIKRSSLQAHRALGGYFSSGDSAGPCSWVSLRQGAQAAKVPPLLVSPNQPHSPGPAVVVQYAAVDTEGSQHDSLRERKGEEGGGGGTFGVPTSQASDGDNENAKESQQQRSGKCRRVYKLGRQGRKRWSQPPKARNFRPPMFAIIRLLLYPLVPILSLALMAIVRWVWFQSSVPSSEGLSRTSSILRASQGVLCLVVFLLNPALNRTFRELRNNLNYKRQR
ncbi:hypothetical protein EV182_000010 [Spiromyces aspiralis]|uniref:Uncharacterized protein n=1 Tax=Spiromyces aspiralis TaxID=68401 RepID=A0ACC1HV22_9FUNG|nr:hypothetical protein EV182_000010 [Spiromyces aspiralis]